MVWVSLVKYTIALFDCFSDCADFRHRVCYGGRVLDGRVIGGRVLDGRSLWRRFASAHCLFWLIGARQWATLHASRCLISARAPELPPHTRTPNTAPSHAQNTQERTLTWIRINTNRINIKPIGLYTLKELKAIFQQFVPFSATASVIFRGKC